MSLPSYKTIDNLINKNYLEIVSTDDENGWFWNLETHTLQVYQDEDRFCAVLYEAKNNMTDWSNFKRLPEHDFAY